MATSSDYFFDYNSLSYRGVTDAMEMMQRQYDQKYRRMQEEMYRMNYPAYFVDSSTYTQAQIAPTKESKEATEKAKKLKNLIAHYYHRK